MVDPTQIIWEHLTGTGTTLYSLVAKQVWSPSAPRAWRNTSKAVIFEMISEELHPTARTAQCRAMFYCYGASTSHNDARAVYAALVDRLHGVIGANVASGQISYATLVDGSPGEREPETEWPYARAMFELRIVSN